MQNNLKVGPLTIAFHRTVRVHPDDKSHLPPSLGYLPLYKVADYRVNCPASWENDAVFTALHDKEALWLSFSSPSPVALLLGAGGVNALNGEKLGLKLDKDNYLVSPPQPWLDGWKDKDGTVYQFVSTQYKKGEGLSVGEQLHKEECKTGGLGIAVFESKNPISTRKISTPDEISFGGIPSTISFGEPPAINAYFSGQDKLLSKSPPGGAHCCSRGNETELKATPRVMHRTSVTREIVAKEMAIGKGGKIHQKIYQDPYGIETWKEEPAGAVAVYLLNSQDFSQVTGLPMPPLPKAAADYYGKWYKLDDNYLADNPGSDKFTKLESVDKLENVFPAKDK